MQAEASNVSNERWRRVHARGRAKKHIVRALAYRNGHATWIPPRTHSQVSVKSSAEELDRILETRRRIVLVLKHLELETLIALVNAYDATVHPRVRRRLRKLERVIDADQRLNDLYRKVKNNSP